MADPAAPRFPADRCASCGAHNACQMAARDDAEGGRPCWCAANRVGDAALRRVPEAVGPNACLCSACLTTSTAEPGDAVRWLLDAGGRPTIELRDGAQRARIATTGAQLLSWLADVGEVLWCAGAASYDWDRAVRGGIPIVFPWFGSNRADATLPAHGFARDACWRCTAIGPRARVTLTLEDDEQRRRVWPHRFRADLEVALTDGGLELRLTIENRDQDAFTFENALHSYFAVSDVHSAVVHGLENVPFVEHARQPEAAPDPTKPLRFRAETDRVFQGTPDEITLTTAALRREVRLHTRGARSAIVWNPWPEKTARLSQMLADDWRGFCCIESANVHDNAIVLPPGAQHTLHLRLTATANATPPS